MLTRNALDTQTNQDDMMIKIIRHTPLPRQRNLVTYYQTELFTNSKTHWTDINTLPSIQHTHAVTKVTQIRHQTITKATHSSPKQCNYSLKP